MKLARPLPAWPTASNVRRIMVRISSPTCGVWEETGDVVNWASSAAVVWNCNSDRRLSSCTCSSALGTVIGKDATRLDCRLAGHMELNGLDPGGTASLQNTICAGSASKRSCYTRTSRKLRNGPGRYGHSSEKVAARRPVSLRHSPATRNSMLRQSSS